MEKSLNMTEEKNGVLQSINTDKWQREKKSTENMQPEF